MAGNYPNAVRPMGPKAFTCPGCGGQVVVRAPGQTISCVCNHCGAVADLTDPNYQIIGNAHAAEEKWARRGLAPQIPMGSRGKLEGIEWEVIGYVVRQAIPWDFFWSEYLLFNPIYGFRFLVDSQGHWNLVQMLALRPQVQGNPKFLNYEGNRFQRHTQGKAEVMYVVGEFYWRVAIGETVSTYDLVAPPVMLSREGDEAGVVWSKGRYLEPHEVREAFNLDKPLRPKKGVGPNQPNPYSANKRGTLRVFWAALLLTFALQILFTARSPGLSVFNASLSYDKADSVYVFPPFDIPPDGGNVSVTLHANVDNNWAEVEGQLANMATNEAVGFLIGAEYYHGVDGGESWSEGGQDAEVVLNNVPGGKYELALTPAAGTLGPSMDIALKRGVPLWSNWVLLIFLLLPVPLWYFFRNMIFENKRWEDAD